MITHPHFLQDLLAEIKKIRIDVLEAKVASEEGQGPGGRGGEGRGRK